MKDDGEVERIIRHFKGTDEVSTLYIFGSLGKDKKTGESDIDIAVLIDESKLQRKNFEKLRVSFTERAITEYLDYKPIEDICLKAVANRFRGKSIGSI